MKIHIELTSQFDLEPLRIGNVYPVKGGYGTRDGHMMICIAITKPRPVVGCFALMLIVDREGEPVNVTKYGTHVFEDRMPIAFVEGLEGLEFRMTSL
jgi:hypothetical protein